MAYKNSHSLKRLNKRLHAIIPSHQNTAMVLSSLLNLSKEAIYRRLRGSTPFSLEELLQLREVYGLSIDELTGETQSIAFTFRPLYNQPMQIHDYLNEILVRFKKLSQPRDCVTYNLCEDLPFFRQFGYKTLSCFKLFYWKHAILHDREFKYKQFETTAIDIKLTDLTAKIYDLYTHISSAEIWTKKTIEGTLRQIDYLDDCGLFINHETMYEVYNDLMELLSDLFRDARYSTKFDSNLIIQGDFTLHLCGLSLENNSIYLETLEPKYLATGFNNFNSLQTTDRRVLDEYKSWLKVMLSKSTTISGQAERIRHQFHRESIATVLQSAQVRLPKTAFEELYQLHGMGFYSSLQNG